MCLVCGVLELSVVIGVCGVCDMCMCLSCGGLGGVGVIGGGGLGLGFTNPGKSGICVCALVAVVWVVLVGELVCGLGNSS